MSEMTDWGAVHEPGRFYSSEGEGKNNRAKDKNQQEIEDLRQQLNQHEALFAECRKLMHDLSQPLTYLLTALELSEWSGEVPQEDVASMLEAARDIRDQLQAFRTSHLQK